MAADPTTIVRVPRRQAPRGLRRLAVRGGAAVFAAVTVAALAGNDPGAGSEPAFDVPSTTIAAPPAAPPAGAPGAVPSRSGGTQGGGGGLGTRSALPGPVAGIGASGSSDGSSSSPRPSPSEPTSVAVVTPTLRFFEFGSRMGMPLMCGLAGSAASSTIPDPATLQVVATIVSSCIEFGHEGAASMAAMNEQLAALAALNPATQPVIAALVDTFNTAGEQPVPFASTIRAMGSLIGFFAG